MKKLLLFALLLSAAAPAVAQAPAIRYGWAPKPALIAPYVAPNRAIWRLADLQKAHANDQRWSQVAVRDPIGLTGTYIQSAPGDVSQRVLYSDSTIFFVVQSGQLRVLIDGVEPFIATKGFLVQVPSLRYFHVETVSDAPALRFEVTQTRSLPYYTVDETPAPVPGRKYERAIYYGNPIPYGNRKPFIDFQKDIVSGGLDGSGLVRDDYIAADIDRSPAGPRPPANERGHFHLGSELWLVLEGQVDYQIEGARAFTAQQGDVIFAPTGRWHRLTSGGTGAAATVSARPVHESLSAVDQVR